MYVSDGDAGGDPNQQGRRPPGRSVRPYRGGALQEGTRSLREVQVRTRSFGPGDVGVGARRLIPLTPIPTHGHEPPAGGLVCQGPAHFGPFLPVGPVEGYFADYVR